MTCRFLKSFMISLTNLKSRTRGYASFDYERPAINSLIC